MMTRDGKLIQNGNGMLKSTNSAAILLRENLKKEFCKKKDNLAGLQVNTMPTANDLGVHMARRILEKKTLSPFLNSLYDR